MAVPGFIDIHCHSDAVIFHPGKNRNRLLQGFTTEVIGNCGLSLAPTAPETLDALRQYCGPFFSYMPVPYNWRSFSEYLTALERQQPLLNTAALVGHGTLRIALAGLENRPLTDGEQETMNGLLRECLEAGGFRFFYGTILCARRFCRPAGDFTAGKDHGGIRRTVCNASPQREQASGGVCGGNAVPCRAERRPCGILAP